jgi:hypothetical protein
MKRTAPISIAIALAATFALLPAVQAQEVVWSGQAGGASDAIANCLVRRVTGQFAAFPIVSPPPQRQAYVRLWATRNDSDSRPPLGEFLIQDAGDGKTSISWQRFGAPPRAGKDAFARQAASQCGTNPR